MEGGERSFLNDERSRAGLTRVRLTFSSSTRVASGSTRPAGVMNYVSKLGRQLFKLPPRLRGGVGNGFSQIQK